MRASVNRPILRPLSFALMVVVFLVIIGRNLYVNSINARLATAVQTGRLTEVIALLDQHANPRYIAQVTVPQSGDSSRPTSYYPAATLSLALDRLLQADRNLLRLLYPAAPPGAPQKAPAPDLDSPGIKAAQAQYAEAEEIVCLLLRRGANPVSEPDQESYLAKACDCGSLKVMRLLFEMAPDIDRLDEKGGAPGIAHGYGRAAAIYPGPETQAQFERYCALKSQAMLKLLQEHGARLNLAQACMSGIWRRCID